MDRPVHRPEDAEVTLPFWIVVVTSASAGVFTFGRLSALVLSSVNDLALDFSPREMTLCAIVLAWLVALIGAGGYRYVRREW